MYGNKAESIIALLQRVCQTVRNPSKTAWKQNFCCADKPTRQFTFKWVTATTHSQSSGDPPAMCQEAAADVTRAVTARRGAGHALCLARLPRKLDAIQVAVLLPLCCYGASWRTSVGRVLPCHMSLTIAARDRTPGGSEWDVLAQQCVSLSLLNSHWLIVEVDSIIFSQWPAESQLQALWYTLQRVSLWVNIVRLFLSLSYAFT